MKSLCAALVCVFSLCLVSCGNKAAYRNINTSREAADANRNSAQAAAAVTDQSNSSAQPATPPQPFKPPKFMVNGQAKDLPNYPQAITKTIQYGPVEGSDTFSLVLETRDSMEKIAAFYDKAIKSNGWFVDSRTVDSEFAEWNLKKAFDNEGKVQVRKDPRTSAMNIVIVRTEKISGGSAKTSSDNGNHR
jgi:hypothetical protein